MELQGLEAQIEIELHACHFRAVIKMGTTTYLAFYANINDRHLFQHPVLVRMNKATSKSMDVHRSKDLADHSWNMHVSFTHFSIPTSTRNSAPSPRKKIRSSTANLPSDILDTHLLTSLLIVIKPLSLSQIDSRKLRVRLNTSGLEIALEINVSIRKPLPQRERVSLAKFCLNAPLP